VVENTAYIGYGSTGEFIDIVSRSVVSSFTLIPTSDETFSEAIAA
jgi:hypothetical protein